MADSKAESKGGFERKLSGKGLDDDDEIFLSDDKASNDTDVDVPRVDVLDIKIGPKSLSEISTPLTLDLKFELDRDVVAGYWVVKFLVDSSYNRIIKVLGETPVEDYPDGESEMHFEASSINVDGIKPSTLTNAGLLSAVFMANGVEVATVNMVRPKNVLL